MRGKLHLKISLKIYGSLTHGPDASWRSRETDGA